jgi:diaminopimelate epimerase
MVRFAKAHAFGNDFLYVEAKAVEGLSLDAVARTMCDRHTGIGADGLILYERTPEGATMTLLNADGGLAEVSGNGLRGLGALLLAHDDRAGASISIRTGAGDKRLVRLAVDSGRQTFRSSMGRPSNIRKQAISAGGETIEAVLLDMGNPQCVVLGPQPDDERFRRLGSALEKHAIFPQGTNVEFATVGDPRHVTIRIWERGCGPTLSSGTGSCASLVAAAAYGGAQRDAEVIAPGGTQRVEWLDDGVYLTGWAEVICEGEWSRPLPHG